MAEPILKLELLEAKPDYNPSEGHILLYPFQTSLWVRFPSGTDIELLSQGQSDISEGLVTYELPTEKYPPIPGFTAIQLNKLIGAIVKNINDLVAGGENISKFVNDNQFQPLYLPSSGIIVYTTQGSQNPLQYTTSLVQVNSSQSSDLPQVNRSGILDTLTSLGIRRAVWNDGNYIWVFQDGQSGPVHSKWKRTLVDSDVLGNESGLVGSVYRFLVSEGVTTSNALTQSTISSGDLDNYKGGGFWHLNSTNGSVSNCPLDYDDCVGSLEVKPINNGEVIQYIYRQDSSNILNGVLTRRYNGSWSPWFKMDMTEVSKPSGSTITCVNCTASPQMASYPNGTSVTITAWSDNEEAKYGNVTGSGAPGTSKTYTFTTTEGTDYSFSVPVLSQATSVNFHFPMEVSPSDYCTITYDKFSGGTAEVTETSVVNNVNPGGSFRIVAAIGHGPDEGQTDPAVDIILNDVVVQSYQPAYPTTIDYQGTFSTAQSQTLTIQLKSADDTTR